MKKFPNAFVIIVAFIFFAWVLTYILPQGTYERIVDKESGITTVIGDSYKEIEGQRLSAFDLMLAVPRGIAGRAETIVLILLIGGSFYVIEQTGAFAQGLGKLVHLLSGRETLALVIVSFLFMMGGATIGMQEEVIAMIPILILFGQSLGYDVFTVIYMSYGSTVLGSSLSPSNPFAVLIAQKEAGLPLLSGAEFRVIILALVFVVWVWYLLRYAKKHRIDKEEASTSPQPMTVGSKIILALLGLTFAVVVYGMLMFDWGFNELSACFFALGLLAGLIGKLGLNKTGDMYLAGFKEMIFAAIIIGMANSIGLVLKEGMIIDTIVHTLFGPLQYLPPTVSAVLMMISHTLLHFPIPSYSGQAVLTMPVLVPLSDLIGVTRQTCVLAYQYGAVMMDMIVPTNGALMAVLAVCGIPYNKWLRIAIVPTLLILLLCGLSIIVAVFMGYS
ncbi:YfcC family protein [Pareuzebyella sediminis]|uniref:YfcC family protein n=1 Tax=Pareuzebyella sediminis TaxID=2607998 RepID=UPI0011EE4FE4|nr:Na+/H+ antiporter NhaC family protein [Pareuzebyella sediminis]